MTPLPDPAENRIRNILQQTRTIALVGASPRQERPSNSVMQFMQDRGYRVIPVNPGHDGLLIHGEKTYPTLDHIPVPFQMVDIFRHSDAAARVVHDVLKLPTKTGVAYIWMQLGVCHEKAAHAAGDAGLQVVMDRCPKIEYLRLFGERPRTSITTDLAETPDP